MVPSTSQEDKQAQEPILMVGLTLSTAFLTSWAKFLKASPLAFKYASLNLFLPPETIWIKIQRMDMVDLNMRNITVEVPEGDDRFADIGN